MITTARSYQLCCSTGEVVSVDAAPHTGLLSYLVPHPPDSWRRVWLRGDSLLRRNQAIVHDLRPVTMSHREEIVLDRIIPALSRLPVDANRNTPVA